MLRLAAAGHEPTPASGPEGAANGQDQNKTQQNKTGISVGPRTFRPAAPAGRGGDTKGAFTKAGVQLGNAHAAPAFEAEADYVSMYYMARAGYSTAGVEDFWRKMAVEAPGAIFIKSDHPTTPDRFLGIAATEKEIED